ncbi:MAG: hypothetical protein MR690_07605 [Rikenellaceae bacterium]|nr:hypothetical protein [Rikenellaceae bacterium]
MKWSYDENSAILACCFADIINAPFKRFLQLYFALQDNKLGEKVPWVTVSRDDMDFDSRDGNYWKGAMWLPNAYMAIKSLQSYDLLEEASSKRQEAQDTSG